MFHEVLEIEEKAEAIMKYGLLTAMPVSLPLEGEFLRYYLTSVSRCLLALEIPSCDNLRCFHSAIFRVHHIDERYCLENLGLILSCQKTYLKNAHKLKLLQTHMEAFFKLTEHMQSLLLGS